MSFSGIGGIGGGGSDWNRRSSGPPPPGGGDDDNRQKIDRKKEVKDDPMNPIDKLTLSTPAEEIEQLEQLTYEKLAQVAPGLLTFIEADHAVMTDPVLKQRIVDIRRKHTISAGARAYQMNQSAYPLPVQPIEPIAPVNPDPEPRQDMPERDEEKDAEEEKPEEEA